MVKQVRRHHHHPFTSNLVIITGSGKSYRYAILTILLEKKLLLMLF
jgi:hypothetical protein